MSSKRGRPARQMNEEKIIQIVMDFYRNPEYLKKLLFELDTYDEEVYIIEYLKNLHNRLSKTTPNKCDFIESSASVDKKLESIENSSKTDSEIQERIDELKGRIPVIKDEDVKEFQSVIEKLPDQLWKRYNNRLRQKSYKKNNRWSKQIEFNEDAYYELRCLKDSLNAKTWNDLPFQLESDYKLIRSICDSLQVNNLDSALMRINELLLLQKNK